MKKVNVRCWEVRIFRQGNDSPDILYVTYPEDNNGYDLITCLKCGKIYAVNVAIEVYVGPSLREKLRNIKCIECGESLGENYAFYPSNYVAGGNIFNYEKSLEIPLVENSIIKEFDGIYDE